MDPNQSAVTVDSNSAGTFQKFSPAWRPFRHNSCLGEIKIFPKRSIRIPESRSWMLHRALFPGLPRKRPVDNPGSGFGNSDSGFRRGHVCGNQLYVRVGSKRLGQKDGSARHSGRIRRTDPPALETDPPSTTNAYSGAAKRNYWFGKTNQTKPNQTKPNQTKPIQIVAVLLPRKTRLWY